MEELRRFCFFILLCLAQALVFNRIHLFGCATPMLYVYFVLLFRRGYPKWGILLWSFFLGISIDILSNTPGMSSASLTLIAVLQPYALEAFTPRDSVDDMMPGIRTQGFVKFAYYMLLLTLLYMFVFFTLEAFNFFNWQQWLLNIGGSWLLTIVLVLAIENLRR